MAHEAAVALGFRAHEKDERLPVKSFHVGHEYFHRIVKALASGGKCGVGGPATALVLIGQDGTWDDPSATYGAAVICTSELSGGSEVATGHRDIVRVGRTLAWMQDLPRVYKKTAP